MNTIALDFQTILWILAGLIILGLCHRLVWMLARWSDSFLGIITRMGLKSVAKLLLAILVNYDQRTYQRSRFMLQNQIPFRFALLWAGAIVAIGVLCILKVGRTIHSVGQPILWLLVGYVAYRSFRYWMAPRQAVSAPDSIHPEVKEQHQCRYSLIRPWDYLDELFA